ncbi:MAG: zf-HC2 domain-containing protein [Arthrobacter sp.]|uniref:zf-HC2 domain-containing protein n=1 Tax=Arthrobacter sp. TaxID=1667 RepID=UPI00346B1EA9
MLHRQRRWLDAYLDGELPEERRGSLESHVQGCAECRVHLEERRRLRRRLRALSATPSAGHRPDAAFVDRLINADQFRELPGPWPGAAVPGQAANAVHGSRTVPSAGTDPSPRGVPPTLTVPSAGAFPGGEASPEWAARMSEYRRLGRLRVMLPALASVAVFALVAGVLGAAWFLGRTPDGPVAAAEAVAADAAAASWDEAGTALATSDLRRLRAAGWNCPELGGTGLTLDQATGHRVDGAPQLVLEFSGSAGTVRIAETRVERAAFGTSGPADAGSDVVPERAAPGNGALPDPTAADGTDDSPGEPPAVASVVTAVGRQLAGAPAVVRAHGAGTMSIEMDSAAYDIDSTLADGGTEAIIRRIVATENARLVPEAPADPEFWERIGRGLARLMVLDTGA